MKFVCTYAIYLFLLATGIKVSAQIASQSGKTYAVIVGISAYQNKIIPQLNYSDKDASIFASYLQSAAGGSVPNANIKLFQNENATIAALYNAMDWLKKTCKENDKIYIYFSGHGDVENNNKTSLGYLLAYNTPPNNYSNNTAIGLEKLNNAANILTLKNKASVILITDACHSGKLAGDFFKGKQLVATQLRQVLNNEVRLTACAENEEAAEGQQWGGGRGVFSYYLIKGLKGLAKRKSDSLINLQALKMFLDSSFSNDRFLQQGKLQQHPLVDGNKNFLLTGPDVATIAALEVGSANTDLPIDKSTIELQGFKALQPKPLDIFFSIIQKQNIENMLDFKSYHSLSADKIAITILDDYIKKKPPSDVDDLANYNKLKGQLVVNKGIVKDFNERFVEMVQNKGQDMINAYLAGDLAELEKRQYYYAGNEQYSDFLAMLDVAIQLTPATDYLNNVLELDKNYLSGLVNRLEIAESSNTKSFVNTDSLFKAAVSHEQQALKLDPLGAYVRNELGVLYMQQGKNDSANSCFMLASELAPTWAIPWSNQILLKLNSGQLNEADKAYKITDSLKPNMACALMNEGLVMEKKGDLLAAVSFYKKAIAENKVYYLPYDRLASIYLQIGEYAKANEFWEADINKQEANGQNMLDDSVQPKNNVEKLKRALNDETYQLYLRKIDSFPRDYIWQEKAGLFLYHHIALSFNQLPVEAYPSFYKSIQQFPDSMILELTNEADPLKQALALLQQSVKLSPVYVPPAEVQEAIADLKSWVGDNQKAIKDYYALTNRYPQNKPYRDKLIDLLIVNLSYQAAAAQLDTLYLQKQIAQSQIPILANYQLVRGKYKQAVELLKLYHPTNQSESVEYKMLAIRTNMLLGAPANALGFLNDLATVAATNYSDPLSKTNDDEQNYWMDFKAYATAKVYASQKNYDKALDILKVATDNGFALKYVLNNDKTWSTISGTLKWNKLLSDHHLTLNDFASPKKDFKNRIQNRTPGFRVSY